MGRHRVSPSLWKGMAAPTHLEAQNTCSPFSPTHEQTGEGLDEGAPFCRCCCDGSIAIPREPCVHAGVRNWPAWGHCTQCHQQLCRVCRGEGPISEHRCCGCLIVNEGGGIRIVNSVLCTAYCVWYALRILCGVSCIAYRIAYIYIYTVYRVFCIAYRALCIAHCVLSYPSVKPVR